VRWTRGAVTGWGLYRSALRARLRPTMAS
jgi:hypothetical protein